MDLRDSGRGRRDVANGSGRTKERARRIVDAVVNERAASLAAVDSIGVNPGRALELRERILISLATRGASCRAPVSL